MTATLAPHCSTLHYPQHSTIGSISTTNFRLNCVIINFFPAYLHFTLLPCSVFPGSHRIVMYRTVECSEILGQTDSAKKLYEEVISLQPHNVLAHAGIGLLLLGTGNSYSTLLYSTFFCSALLCSAPLCSLLHCIALHVPSLAWLIVRLS